MQTIIHIRSDLRSHFYTIACFLALMLAYPVTAQTLTPLYSFTATNGSTFTNSDGASPYAELILSSNVLYGTTYGGGSGGAGSVFRVNTDGTAFTNLHSFPVTSGPMTTNSDGSKLYGGLLLSGNTLYGTAAYGGSAGRGTVFKVNTDGSNFTLLHDFPASDHGQPCGSLILSGDTLYGVAVKGGSSGYGSVFAIQTNGTGFTNLHHFTFAANDASGPHAALTLSGNTLYGTAALGGSQAFANGGCVFKVNTDGTGYTNLYNFTGSDGSNPQAALVLVSNTLYGTTQYGGSANKGVVFKVNTDGTGYTNLHSFLGGWDEAYTFAGLALSGNTLYGTTYMGGDANVGTVFQISTDGSGFTNLYHFTGSSDGASPRAAVMVSGGTLYGTASAAGSSGNGTVFRISLPSPPQLTINCSGTTVVLTWPTNATGFTLKSATNLFSTALWISNFPAPVVINGQYAVTNPVSGTQQFFRLSQ